MKIMHIIQAPGGVERYIQMFLDNSSMMPWENILVCSYDYDQSKYSSYTNICAFENIEMSREISLVKDLHAVKQVRNKIKKYRPDIVYCHSSKAGAIGRIADIGIRNKLVYNPHGWAFNMQCSGKKKKLYLLVEKFLAKLTDKVIVISEFERQSALDNKVCKDKAMRVIYNGIDIERYNKCIKVNIISRESLSIPENAYIIGFVGRLSEQKSPDIFVRVAKRIKEKIPNAYFIMVGDGPERQEIEKYLVDNELDDYFLITGWVDNPISYIMLFDQGMLLSRWEGFGLVLAEYMWARVPIIATSVDAIPNLIQNNENGLLINKDDIEDAVNNVLKIHNDSVLRDRLVNNSYSCVSNRFTIERVVEEHRELFSNLINEAEK